MSASTIPAPNPLVAARHHAATMAGEDAGRSERGWTPGHLNALLRSWRDLPDQMRLVSDLEGLVGSVERALGELEALDADHYARFGTHAVIPVDVAVARIRYAMTAGRD